MLGMGPLGAFALGELPFGFVPSQEQLFIKPAVGWDESWDRRPRTREELEAKLAEQREQTFGRRWFKEYQAAQEAAQARAESATSEQTRAALDEAIEAGLRAVDQAIAARQSAKLLKEIVAAQAAALKERIFAADDEGDEEDVLMLLQLI